MRHLFRQTCTIQNATRVAGSDYQIVPAWVTAATEVPCMVQIRNASTRKTPSGEDYRFGAVAYFDSGVALRPAPQDNSEGSRIVLSTGETYYVRGVDQIPAGIGGHTRAFLEAQG